MTSNETGVAHTSGGDGRTAHQQRESPTQQQLREVWEHVMGPGPIGLHDNLFDLGADSHLFDRLLTEVRSTFGMLAEGLPIHDMAEKPTIDGLARMIDANLELQPSLLVCLQPQGSRRPLFLIHDGGGYVFYYRALASRLAPDQPVYAIRAETTADGFGQPFHQCQAIEELAARYIADIKAIQPKGPYALGGASLGGVVAFEMGRQLRLAGEEVGTVLLISALVRSGPTASGPDATPPPWGVGRLQRRIAHHLSHASQLRPGDAVRYVSDKILSNVASEGMAAVRDVRRGVRDMASDLAGQVALRQRRARSKPMPPQLIYRCLLNLKTGDRLLAKYVPSACDLRLAVFRPANDHDPEPGWRGLAQRGMDVYDLPGGHLDLLEEPTAGTTAALVRRCLE
jgi:thioesterase domain-containing protein